MKCIDVCIKYSSLFPKEKASSFNTFTALSSDRLKEELANQSKYFVQKNFIHFLLVFGLTSIKVQSQGLYILSWLEILVSSVNILRACTCIASSEKAENLSNLVLCKALELDKKIQKSKSVP